MKFFLPFALFSVAFLSKAEAAVADPTCETDADLVNSAPTEYEGSPITIIKQEETTVTFTVSQTWSDDLLCLIATHFTDDSGEVCPDVANAAPGEVAEYTAECVGGFATVDLYAFDPTFPDNASPPTINGICPQVDTKKTLLYQYSIPCGSPTCPTPTEPTCEDLKATSYDFENAAHADEWMFGTTGTTSGNSYLTLDKDTLEISKSFEAPSGTTEMKFAFDFLVISAMASDQKIYARVGDYYLNMSAAQSLPMAGQKTEYFGEIKTTIAKIGLSSNLHVEITVPSALYADGHVSLGVRTFGSSSTYKAGVDNVEVNLACDDGLSGGNKNGGGGGDPHFQRWGREHSSFHGECDLVMVRSEQFHNNAGLDLHVRTTIQDYFSYIESAALRVGENVLEFHKAHFYLDGAKYTAEDLPLTFGGDFKYTVSEAPIEAGKNPKFHKYFKVDLHEDSSILFKFYKNFLTIAVSGHENDFSDSVGLLGDYSTGDMLSREGVVMTDFDQYGFEWQVNPEDAKLFMDARAPQLPYEQCRMPTAARPARRKLRGADAALFEAAKSACAHVSGSDYDLCADDVMATGDVGLAELW